MNPLRNKYVVIVLGLAALALVANSLRPLWQGRRPAAPAKSAAAQASTPAPATPVASNASTPPASPSQAKAARPQRTIDLAQTGWSVDGTPRRDPFHLITPGTGGAPRLYPPAAEVLSLTAIWWQSGTNLAVVSSNVVSEGDTIKGFKIEHIGLERVWVNGPNGPEQIEFDPTLSLRGISLNSGKSLDETFAGAMARLDWPYRVVNGITNDVTADADWHMLRGTIVQKISSGRYLVSFEDRNRPPFVSKGQHVLVMNVPLNLVDGDPLQSIECKRVGSETYEAVSGAKTTVHALDFGQPCSPPTEAVKALKILKEMLRREQSEVNERRMKFDRLEAENGSAVAQYMLGRRYLYGDGVPKDEILARQWLEKAAAQGIRDAQDTLHLIAYKK